jgi:hypothetical protein
MVVILVAQPDEIHRAKTIIVYITLRDMNETVRNLP